MTPVDYSALSAPLDRYAVRRLRREWLAADKDPSEFSYPALLIASSGGATLALGMLAVVWFNRRPFTGLLGLVEIAFFAIVVPLALLQLVIGIPLGITGIRRQWPSLYRARAFAVDNGMTFSPRSDAPTVEGALFTVAGAEKRRCGNVFETTGTGSVTVAGRYLYHLGQKVLNWGFISVDLERPVPHMIVRDTVRRRKDHDLFSGLKDSEPASTGGDGGRFAIHTPGAEATRADSDSIFTPELLDRVGALGPCVDAETRGHRLFVYSSKPFALNRAPVVRRVFSVVEAAGCL